MKRDKTIKESSSKSGRTPLSKEARENRCINLALKRAEEQLLDGTASSQVITHFLKLGSLKEELEKENLKADIALKNKKVEAIDEMKKTEETYLEAIKAMQIYKGGAFSDENNKDI